METTLLEELTAWLDDANYDAGVMLYERALGTDFLLTMLKSGADAYNRRRLEQALQAEHTRLSELASQQQAHYPEPLTADLGQAGVLMDERTVLKEQLRIAYEQGRINGPDNKTIAYRILAIRDLLDGIFGRRRFFDQHGFLPADTAPLAADPDTQAERLRRRNTLRTYVTRYRKAAMSATDADKREAAIRLLQQYENELHQLDQLINHAPAD